LRDKNLLLVSYFFPPMGMGGVQRAAKTAKYLARDGWNVTVLTCTPDVSPYRDESLLHDLPPDIEIIRRSDPLGISKKTDSSYGYILKTGSGLMGRMARIPDSKVFWASKASEKAARIIKEKFIGYIMTTSPPPSVHKVGLSLKKHFGVKWLADFRDPWFADELRPLTPFHAILKARLEKDIIKNADAITSVTSSHRKDLILRYPQHESKIYHIPNGYDPEDFDGLIESNPSNLTFAHCGTLCSRDGVEAFFDGLEECVSGGAEVASKIEFNQIGAVNEDIHDLLTKKYNHKIKINFSGYLSHKDALQILARASVVVVFGGVSTESIEIIPAKLYEGLALKKTVAAVVPKESAVYDVIKDVPGAYHLDPDDATALGNSMNKIISAYNSGTLFHESRESLIQKYSRKYLADQIGKLLEGV